jgi:hypothetical protein
MSEQSSRFTVSARRGSAIAASLAIAAFGVGAAGCGGDDEQNANEAVDSVQQQATEAQKSISTAIDQAQQQGTEAQQKAQDQIDQAKQDYGY